MPKARKLRARRIGLAIAGPALLVAAGLAWLELRPASAPSGETYAAIVRCDSCQQDLEVRVPFEFGFPTACPVCRRVIGQPLWACRSCGVRFAPRDEAAVQVCPECRSPAVGSAAAAAADGS